MREANAGLATSLVVHGLAAVALSHVAWHATPPAALGRPAVVWLGEWAELTAPGRQDGADLVDSDRAAPGAPPAPTDQRGTMDAAVPEAPVPSTAPEAAVDRASPAQADVEARIAVDWTEERRRAIEDVLERHDRAASYRSFSFPGTLADEHSYATVVAQERIEAGLAPVRTAFDSPAKGRAGLSETTVLGEHIVWISDECYAKVGSASGLLLLPSTVGLVDVPMTTCVRVHARDDLFRNAQPRYRMSAAERAEATRHFARTDPGAIATFED